MVLKGAPYRDKARQTRTGRTRLGVKVLTRSDKVNAADADCLDMAMHGTIGRGGARSAEANLDSMGFDKADTACRGGACET